MNKENEFVKVVVFVPESHADELREAIGKAGGGKIGDYSYCTFSVKGVGRFKPLEGADPTVGEIGKIESVKEERIEFVCPKAAVKNVIQKIKNIHPYEEVALDVYPLLNLE